MRMPTCVYKCISVRMHVWCGVPVSVCDPHGGQRRRPLISISDIIIDFSIYRFSETCIHRVVNRSFYRFIDSYIVESSAQYSYKHTHCVIIVMHICIYIYIYIGCMI